MVQLEHSLKTIYFSGIVFNEDKNDDVTSQCKGCRGKGKGQSSGNLSAAACVQPHLALSTPTSSSNHPQYFFGPLCIPRTCRPSISMWYSTSISLACPFLSLPGCPLLLSRSISRVLPSKVIVGSTTSSSYMWEPATKHRKASMQSQTYIQISKFLKHPMIGISQ